MSNKDTTVVHTSNGLVSGIIIGALVIIVAGGAYFYFGGNVPSDDKEINLKLELPKAE